jgi:hypothetical protein
MTYPSRWLVRGLASVVPVLLPIFLALVFAGTILRWLAEARIME